MRLELYQDGIRITELKELAAPNARAVRDAVIGAVSGDRAVISVDMSTVVHIDSAGLGALLSLHKAAARHGGKVRIYSPMPPVQQVLELTRMHLLLEIMPPGCRVPESSAGSETPSRAPARAAKDRMDTHDLGIPQAENG